MYELYINDNSFDYYNNESSQSPYECDSDSFDYLYNQSKLDQNDDEDKRASGLDVHSKYRYCDERTTENKNSHESNYSFYNEICSVNGEIEFNDKIEVAKKQNSDAKSYEALFILIEDKNKYNIGSGDDELSLSSNSEIQNLNDILSNDETNLNDFIGDMLKCCPSDIMIKKQRIYKAKNIKRKRKSKVQIKKLEKEFKVNSNWDKEDFKRLSETLGLTRDQVYKWFWDQKNKKD